MRRLMAFVVLLYGTASAYACEDVMAPKADCVLVESVPPNERWNIVSDEGEPDAEGEILVIIQYKERYYTLSCDGK